MLFLSTLQQVAILLIFILIGYYFKKKGLINDGAKKTMSALLVNLFAPAYGLVSLSQQLSFDKIAQYGIYFLSCIALTVVLVIVARILAKTLSKDTLHQNILKYAFAFGNIGYFGYPVVGAVFGEGMKALMILFCIPMSIGINTYGYTVLTAKVEQNQSVDGVLAKRKVSENFRFLWSVPFIGTMAGLIIGLLPITLPSFIIDLLSLAGNCQSATAMLLTGAVLANIPFVKLFTSFKSYLIGVIKLLILPLAVGAVLYLINVIGLTGETFKTVFMLCVIVAAMPVGMNVVVYPESAGMDSTEGAKMCFLSYVMALGALPLVFTLMELVANTIA